MGGQRGKRAEFYEPRPVDFGDSRRNLGGLSATVLTEAMESVSSRG